MKRMCWILHRPIRRARRQQSISHNPIIRPYGLPVITTRSSNNFGPYQFPVKLIPVLILKALSRQPLPLSMVQDLMCGTGCTSTITARGLRLHTKKEVPARSTTSVPGMKNNLEIAKIVLKTLTMDEDLITLVPDRAGHDSGIRLPQKRSGNSNGLHRIHLKSQWTGLSNGINRTNGGGNRSSDFTGSCSRKTISSALPCTSVQQNSSGISGISGNAS